MDRTFTYRLDEFRPCRTRQGFEIEAVFYGSATIAVTDDDWEVVEVVLDAGKREFDGNRLTWISRHVAIDRADPLFGIIADGLFNYHADDVANAISAAIADGRLSQRSLAQEHGTLNHAQTGVSRG